jgi:alkanesulfonate monooxygenase SsuD/methylene tetrahydromethanopterin reductase-like flavin-dependent oxidoreductase (luciferase family)
VRFGIILDGESSAGQSRQQGLAERLEKARLAKEYGFHSLWVGQGYLNNSWHAATLLARVAAEAPGLELGLVGLMPLQHPVELAEQLSTLDIICDGRLTLAAALGWREFQFDAFGVPKKERLSRFHEVLEAMKALWVQDRVTLHGRHFPMEDVPGASKPQQQPYPKIIIAANLDVGIVRAAETSDGWLISSRATIPTLKRQIGLYQDALHASGRQGYIAAWREMYVADDRKTAVETIRPYAEWLYRDRASQGHSAELPEADRIDLPFDQLLDGRFIIGNPQECIDEIEKYRDLGVDEIIMRCQWPGMPGEAATRAIEMFGRQVLTKFI